MTLTRWKPNERNNSIKGTAGFSGTTTQILQITVICLLRELYDPAILLTRPEMLKTTAKDVDGQATYTVEGPQLQILGQSTCRSTVEDQMRFSWKPHISNLLKKLGHRLSLFNRIFQIFHMLDNRTSTMG